MSFLKKLFGRKKEEQPEQVEKLNEQSQEHIQPQVDKEVPDNTQEEVNKERKEQDQEENLEIEVPNNVEEETNRKEIKKDQEEAQEEVREKILEAIQEEVPNNVEEETNKEVLKKAQEEAQEDVLDNNKEIPEKILEETQEEVPSKIEEETYDEKIEIAQEEVEVEVPGTILQETEEEIPANIEEEQKVVREQEQAEVKVKKKGFFSKLVEGLAKTRDQFLGTVDDVLKGFKKIDEDLYEELEEVLIMADFGVDTTLYIMNRLREIVKAKKMTEPEMLKEALKEIITDILTAQEVTPILDKTKKNVVLVIGVNGVGKTTTIGKLSHQLKQEGNKVVLAAADTFRAAAIDQLAIWADRAGVDLIKHNEGTDPAAVVFDGIQAAKARKADVLICDTAGRLQNKTNLMKELEKISRIIDREYPEANKEVLIVLDATTGQNAISQVKVFKEAAKVDGIVLTKLDGTAKGGAVVGICQSMKVPVKYIGVGEKIEDLQKFDPKAFAEALFGGNLK